MPIPKSALAILALTMVASFARAETPGHYGIGRTATDAEIAGWNIDIGRNGENLPPGSGTVAHGKEIFAKQCAACHGDKGEGGVGDRLVGGQGTIATAKPIKTVGSFWPYAPTLFDYIRRAMPQNAPQSLNSEDVYAVAGYILYLNGLLPAEATLDAERLSAIEMPNRNLFVGDSRPDVNNPACMANC